MFSTIIVLAAFSLAHRVTAYDQYHMKYNYVDGNCSSSQLYWTQAYIFPIDCGRDVNSTRCYYNTNEGTSYNVGCTLGSIPQPHTLPFASAKAYDATATNCSDSHLSSVSIQYLNICLGVKGGGSTNVVIDETGVASQIAYSDKSCQRKTYSQPLVVKSKIGECQIDRNGDVLGLFEQSVNGQPGYGTTVSGAMQVSAQFHLAMLISAAVLANF